ncbi:unnamed protein product [Ceutorhynchus assimilis]|uniref:C2H2-type domain-containing protein n=1 Tax=Ceutorhynchus assimilis TaxID=467358 RepID=A0A9N9MXG1_9CUCU|nr:unnamed protein product [Ceutorhynchus assimilis]
MSKRVICFTSKKVAMSTLDQKITSIYEDEELVFNKNNQSRQRHQILVSIDKNNITEDDEDSDDEAICVDEVDIPACGEKADVVVKQINASDTVLPNYIDKQICVIQSYVVIESIYGGLYSLCLNCYYYHGLEVPLGKHKFVNTHYQRKFYCCEKDDLCCATLTMAFVCTHCLKEFKQKRYIKKHILKTCVKPNDPSKVEDYIIDVEQTFFKKEQTRFCQECNKNVDKQTWNAHLKTNLHKNNSTIKYGNGIDMIRSAFKCRIASYKIYSQKYHVDIKYFLNEARENIFLLIRQKQQEHQSIKVNAELFGVYFSPTLKNMSVKSFNTPFFIVVESTNLDEIYESLAKIILSKADELPERDSGWILQKILHLELNINKHNPLSASSYIAIPYYKSKCLINIRNTDNCCFAWAMVSAV